MSKSRRVSRKPFYIILALSLTLAIGYSVWNTYFRPAPVTIMAIEPVPLTYGDTTISGGLHQEDDGTFILVLPDRRVVTLDVTGIDHLVGLPATIQGDLSPSMTMAVQSITIAQ